MSNLSIEKGSINPKSNTPISLVGSIPSTNSVLNDSNIDLFGFLQKKNINSISGFIHTHSSTSEPTFTVDDVASLGILALNNQISNEEDFIFSLTTGRGDTYSLIIDDINALKTFTYQYFSNDNALNAVKINFLEERANILEGQTNTPERLYRRASESALLNLLSNSGLILAKQRNNNRKWGILERRNPNSETVRNNRCN